MEEVKAIYVHIEKDGVPVYYSHDGDIDVYIIDDNCPNDRVFKLSNLKASSHILDILEKENICHPNDARQKKLISDIEGKPHIEIVK
mgnify:FL=1